MNEKQYAWTVKNRRTYSPRLLFSSQEAAGIVRGLARALRRREAAAEAWQCVAPSEVAAVARVEAFGQGCLLVVVAEPTALHYLRQRAAELRRALAAHLPNLREIRFVLHHGPRRTEQRGDRPSREPAHA